MPLVNCACGCGMVIDPIDAKNRPRRFVSGHNGRGVPRRRFQSDPINYPRERSVRIHRLRAERALGKPLPPGAHVHHADGSKREDAQLVICQDNSYHRLLHARARVQAAGGDPNTEVICKVCRALTPAIGAMGGRVYLCPPCNRRHAERQGRQ